MVQKHEKISGLRPQSVNFSLKFCNLLIVFGLYLGPRIAYSRSRMAVARPKSFYRACFLRKFVIFQCLLSKKSKLAKFRVFWPNLR